MQVENYQTSNDSRHPSQDLAASKHPSPVVPSHNAFALQQKRKYSWDQTIGARVRESQRVREHADIAYASSSTYSTTPDSNLFIAQDEQTPTSNQSAVSWNSKAAALPLPSSSGSTPQSNATHSPPRQSSWTNRINSLKGYKPVPVGRSPLKDDSRPRHADPQTVYRIPTVGDPWQTTTQDPQSRQLYPADPADLVDVPDSNPVPHVPSSRAGEASTKTCTPHHKRIRPRDDDSWKKHNQAHTAERLHRVGLGLPSTEHGTLSSPTDNIQRGPRGQDTSGVQPNDWGRLPFRKGPSDPHRTDTPHLTRSNTRKFAPAPINPRAKQRQLGPANESKATLTSPAYEIKAPLASPQKRVMQKVFDFVKGKPTPVHPVTPQAQDFISGPLPPGITPSKAAQVLGTASTNSRHVLPAVVQSPVPTTPMTPSINGLDLAGTDIHPAMRPQFQTQPSSSMRKRSNTFDSSTSLLPRGTVLTPLDEDSERDLGGGLAGLGLQYYEEKSPPTPPRKDSSYRLPIVRQPSPPKTQAMHVAPRIQIDAARPYPQPRNELTHMVQSMHGAYEMASSSSLTHSEASRKRISKPTGGFSVAASPQLLPGGHLPSWSYMSSPSSADKGDSTPRAGASLANEGSPTPKKRASLVPSPLRQASGQTVRPGDTDATFQPGFGGGHQGSIRPSFQSMSTVEGSMEGSDMRLRSLEARYASLEERVTARLAELSGAQSVLVRGVGEWAANCDAVARSSAQLRQGVMGVSLEVVEVLQEVGGLSGGVREVREGLDLMGRRMRAVERGYGEVRVETKAMAETLAAMQQQLVGIARGVESISIYIVRSAERTHG